MHDGYADARPLRMPTLVRTDLGTGWGTLHELAELFGRPPRSQAVALLLWALWQSQQGENTELNRAQLSEMLGVAEPLEPVA